MSLPQVTHESMIHQHIKSSVQQFREKFSETINPKGSNRDWFLAGFTPITNFFQQIGTFSTCSQTTEDAVYSQIINEYSEEVKQAPVITKHNVFLISTEELKSLAWGNVACIIAALAVSSLGGLGFTLIHGLAHLTIALSLINIIDITHIAHKRNELETLYTDLDTILQKGQTL